MLDKKLSFEELMALILVIILAGVLYALCTQTIPKDNMTLFASLVGNVVVGGLCLYFGYVWGASKVKKVDEPTPVEKKDESPTTD